MSQNDAPDLRTSGEWGIEDTTNGVAGIVIGNAKRAQNEALKLAEYKRAPVNVYMIDGGVWSHYGVARFKGA